MQQMVSLLKILLLAEHVSGNTMHIIRSSRVLYSIILTKLFFTFVQHEIPQAATTV